MSGVDAEDRQTIRLFVEKTDKLRRSEFARVMFTEDTGVTLRFRQGEQPSAEVRGPSEEVVDAMVLTLRMTMQNKDRISVRNVARIMKRIDHDAARRYLAIRDELNSMLDAATNPPLEHKNSESGAVHVFRNGQILRGVIYGELAHTDEKQHAAMQALRWHPWASAMIDNTFHTVAARMLDAVLGLQIAARDVYEHLTRERLPISWPEDPNGDSEPS